LTISEGLLAYGEQTHTGRFLGWRPKLAIGSNEEPRNPERRVEGETNWRPPRLCLPA
jgi:hypothetical protein